MRLGILAYCTADAPSVLDVARVLEDRGFESMWVPQHTHLPAAQGLSGPGGHQLPPAFKALPDPFVTLTAAAAVTERLKVGTAICLVAQHDPIVLAKQIATLDMVSQGRFLFGVGAGWNHGEMANHGVEPRSRWRRALEHVEAMKAIWTEDEPAYDGEWVRFDPIWSWPKPVQRPHPPILIGTFTTESARRFVHLADGWLPSLPPHKLRESLAPIRDLVAEAGRDPDALDITVTCVAPVAPEVLDEYAAAGATRVVVPAYLKTLDDLHDLLEPYQHVVAASA